MELHKIQLKIMDYICTDEFAALEKQYKQDGACGVYIGVFLEYEAKTWCIREAHLFRTLDAIRLKKHLMTMFFSRFDAQRDVDLPPEVVKSGVKNVSIDARPYILYDD